MEMLLNTMRMVDHDQAREHALGDEKSLDEHLPIGIINPKDFEKLNLTPSLHLKISNKNGEIIVGIKKDENIPQGMILMPVSIWANQLTSFESNELIYKNITVNVEATRDPITSFNQIIDSLRNK
jgi:formylmethanofuran dehydrogenase subunit D